MTTSEAGNTLEDASTDALFRELKRRDAMPRCRCGKWRTYVGSWDTDGYAVRCHGCLRAIQKCRC